jgi:hypothetical protein
VEILLIGWPICALVGYMIGKGKGRGGEGAVLGLLLGPIGWLIIAVAQTGEGMRKCPFCAETVKSEAKVCRYCSRDLPSAPPPKPPKELSPARKCVVGVLIILVVGLLVLFACLHGSSDHKDTVTLIQDVDVPFASGAVRIPAGTSLHFTNYNYAAGQLTLEYQGQPFTITRSVTDLKSNQMP